MLESKEVRERSVSGDIDVSLLSSLPINQLFDLSVKDSDLDFESHVGDILDRPGKPGRKKNPKYHPLPIYLLCAHLFRKLPGCPT